MASPAKFLGEVNQERKKVTWPTRKDTTAASIMVFIMVVIFALFFLLVDWAVSSGIQWILDI